MPLSVQVLLTIVALVPVVSLILFGLNFLSYRVMGGIIRNRRETWDLNICCGKTDGGGVNVNTVNHADVPNLVVVDNIYSLALLDESICAHH